MHLIPRKGAAHVQTLVTSSEPESLPSTQNEQDGVCRFQPETALDERIGIDTRTSTSSLAHSTPKSKTSKAQSAQTKHYLTGIENYPIK
jgi:hypothetical protein